MMLSFPNFHENEYTFKDCIEFALETKLAADRTTFLLTS